MSYLQMSDVKATSDIVNDNNAEPEFVLVKDLISGELMELPTVESDNTLGLTTLTHAFPGSHGLKYKTDTGVTRALLLDSTGQKFYPPAGGWSGKTFTVIFNNAPSANFVPVVSESVIPKLRSN
uniref:TAR DNA-binding protein 43 N-terminal domain-containing protein n=1 Tax=Panagrolaimus sp. ES5 TaxID=591445 RepID=A0AC34GHJ8_9BILA